MEEAVANSRQLAATLDLAFLPQIVVELAFPCLLPFKDSFASQILLQPLGYSSMQSIDLKPPAQTDKVIPNLLAVDNMLAEFFAQTVKHLLVVLNAKEAITDRL